MEFFVLPNVRHVSAKPSNVSQNSIIDGRTVRLVELRVSVASRYTASSSGPDEGYKRACFVFALPLALDW